MESDFVRVVVDSTMEKSSFLSGQNHGIQRPCTVYGLYCEKTGTIILEQVWCDGTSYSMKSFDTDEKLKFHDEIRQYVINAF